MVGFLEKNRDTLSANLLETMRNAESQMVCDLFTAPLSNTGALQLKWVNILPWKFAVSYRLFHHKWYISLFQLHVEYFMWCFFHLYCKIALTLLFIDLKQQKSTLHIIFTALMPPSVTESHFCFVNLKICPIPKLEVCLKRQARKSKRGEY